MATKQRHFFATKEDLIPVLAAFDAKHDVKYVLTGLLFSPELTVYTSGGSIDTLAVPARHANAVNGYNYLITPANEPVRIRNCPQTKGGIRYAVDQLINPRTICLLHGGFFSPDILLYGKVGTVSDDPIALKLYRAFCGLITKQFTHIRAFWVGRDAEKLLDSGCRLAIGADSPRDFDLAREQERNVQEL
jgi:hypothetical protein